MSCTFWEEFELKTKLALTATLVFVPVCALLRILQYILVVDKNGYYESPAALAAFLIYGLYGALALAAIFGIALIFWGSRKKINPKSVLGNKLCGVLLISAAALMVADFGISAGSMIKTMIIDIPALLGLIAALFFAALGYNCISGNENSAGIRFWGLFAPIYAVAIAISEFFGTFQKAHVSQTKFEMLSLCALALFLMTLSAFVAGLEISEKRLAAVSLLFAVMTAPASIADAIALASGEITVGITPHFVISVGLQIIFAVLAVAVLVYLAKKPHEYNEEPQPFTDNTL